MATFAEAAHAPSPVQRRFPWPPADAPVRIDAGAARSLASIVAGEIVPRLILAHGDDGDAVPATPSPAFASIDVEAFAPLTLAGDARALLAHVDRLLARGVTADAVMIDLLAPAARLLGQWWEEDRCDFVEVTMGLWRLQEVVRDLAQRVAPSPWRSGRRALFASFPGEDHDFGAVMVSELFHRHGWRSDMVIAADMPTLLAAAGANEYDVIGLTVSCDCHSARLPSAILALRSVSRNPHLRVMVGGRVLNEDPALAGRAGADGTANDARDALLLAEGLVDAVARDAVACC